MILFHSIRFGSIVCKTSHLLDVLYFCIIAYHCTLHFCSTIIHFSSVGDCAFTIQVAFVAVLKFSSIAMPTTT